MFLLVLFDSRATTQKTIRFSVSMDGGFKRITYSRFVGKYVSVLDEGQSWSEARAQTRKLLRSNLHLTDRLRKEENKPGPKEKLFLCMSLEVVDFR